MSSPSSTSSSAAAAEDEEYRAPWHFKLMVVAVVVYLGWRVVQLIGWLT